MEARGEKINVSSGPSKEMAGLKKKIKMMKMKMKIMTPGSQNPRVWELSHEAPKVRRGSFGPMCRYIWTSGVFWRVSKAILVVLAEFEAVWYADHVRFHSGHLYIDRLPTV